MKLFLSEDFLLQTETAKALYHDFAGDMPIIDYHCHLPVQEIAENRSFENLTQIWLNGDHYRQFPGRYGAGQDAVWRRLVVQ